MHHRTMHDENENLRTKILKMCIIPQLWSHNEWSATFFFQDDIQGWVIFHTTKLVNGFFSIPKTIYPETCT